MVSLHTLVVFKAGSKKYLICFEVVPLFMGEDTPDLPVYQWDGYFHLPSACATGFGCNGNGWVKHKGSPSSEGWQETGEVLGQLGGCLCERLQVLQTVSA